MYNSASGVINSLRSWHISCTIGHLTKLYFTKILSSDNFKIRNKSVSSIGAENSTVTRIVAVRLITDEDLVALCGCGTGISMQPHINTTPNKEATTLTPGTSVQSDVADIHLVVTKKPFKYLTFKTAKY